LIKKIFISCKANLFRWILSVSLPVILMACSHRSERRGVLDAQNPSEQSNQFSKNENKMADQESPQREPESSKVRCSIAIEEERWSKGKPAFVSFVIENVSGSIIDMKIIPSFRLVEYSEKADSVGPSGERNQYWSPVDVTKNTTLSSQGALDVKLEKDQTLRSRIDLATLRWARSISAEWPSHDLFKTVSPGRYRSYLTIEELAQSEVQSIRQTKAPGTKTVRSNEVKVVIE
jgi:hypothetical protein